jgi:peptidoglycan hydrolase-like protein with peptidoglycan-binding domain
MQFFKNKIAASIIFALMGLAGAYAQSEIGVYWEIRNYYIDADNPKVEVFLTIDDSVKKKEFIFISPGEAAEISESGQYLLSAWFQYTAFEYRFVIEKGSIRIQVQKVEYLKEVRDFVPVPPGWSEIKKIPISSGKVYVPKAGETILAKNLFHRSLSLQAKRMNGDDVWALQRFLFEQGYREVGEIDGWFGPKTEQAVKSFQAERKLAADGIVRQELWDELSGLEKDQVNFFQGDYGD